MIKHLLNIEYNTSEETVKQRFELIAKQLFNQYEIIKGEKTYDFLEIEFYFYSNNHPDTTTYKRNMPAGLWHTHLSGVDITFESNDDYYGGVLIRSIIDHENKVINGPLCLNSAVFFLVRKFYMLRCLFGTLYVDMRLSLIHIYSPANVMPPFTISIS